jgi:formylglycine-generating enzyme required for sulfatase activity
MRSAFVASLVALVACSDTFTTTLAPTGQVLLYVDTDAPVPPAPGTMRGANDPPPLFDTLLVEVLEPGQSDPCAACSRVFALDVERLRARHASMGIPTKAGTAGYRARVTIFRAANTQGGVAPDGSPEGPVARAALQATVRLPSVTTEGVLEATVVLSVDALGSPAGTVDDPIDATAGPPAASRVGTWAGAQLVDCSDAVAAKPNEVCIHGGAFWMGNVLAIGTGGGNGNDLPRLVVVSPYLLGRSEVTVAEVRGSAQAASIQAWSGASAGDNAFDYCTFTSGKSAADPTDAHAKLPVNCITWDQARTLCRARGADLPTEAQLEYASGGLEGRLYVWGSDTPACGDASFGRTGYGALSILQAPCKPSMPPGGPQQPGSGALDHLDVAGGKVFDLAGNVGEWTLDVWSRQTEACWSSPGLYLDPVCRTASKIDPAAHTVRGGAWEAGTPSELEAAVRYPSSGAGIDTGLRCARPAIAPP